MHLLKLYREKVGWSVRTLSLRADLSPRLMWEMDNNPNYDFKLSTMKKICGTFNLPPSVLFFADIESEKRHMLVAIMRLCMEVTGMNESEFLQLLYLTKTKDADVTNHPRLPPHVVAALKDALAKGSPPSPVHSAVPRSPRGAAPK